MVSNRRKEYDRWFGRGSYKRETRKFNKMVRRVSRPPFGTRYGKMFRTKKGILGRYKYVGKKRVAFVRKYRR